MTNGTPKCNLSESSSLLPLSELCIANTGFVDPTRTPNISFRYVDISSVDNRRKCISEPKTLLGKEAPSRARQAIRANDVLVATTRPNLNAVAIVPPELDGSVCSTGFCVLRSNGRVAPEYLFAFVQSEQFVRCLSDLVQGALYPAVTDKQVRSQPIPFRELAKQQTFATRLREQLAEVELARVAVEEQMNASETLVDALLRESLTTATERLLSECLREVTKGVGDDWAKFPVLGATRAGVALAKDPVGKSPQRYKPVHPGTIFYNPMRILLGSIAMIDEGEAPGITSPDYVVMTGVENRLHPRWFYYWFRSKYGAEFIKSLSRGAVRERLLFKRLAPAKIQIPDWDAQVTFARQLSEIRKLRIALRAKLECIEAIPTGLLQQAFSGNI